MARYGFKIRLRGEEVIEEYERLHRAVDEDVLEAHRRSGISNYSIFRSGLDLFAYLEADDPHSAIASLKSESVMGGWFAKTNPLMAVDENNTPQMTELPEIFYMA